MSRMRARQVALLWNIKQQLLIGSLALLLTSVFAVSSPLQTVQPGKTAEPVETQVTSVPSVPRQASLVHQGVVRRGQTAFVLLQQAGVSAAEVLRLRRAVRPLYDIEYVRVGQRYRIEVTADGLLQRFAYEVDMQHRLEVERQGETFIGRLTPIAYVHKERVVQGVIHGSLYEALAAQGESPKIAADLADIFAWEVDFHTDLRDGDTFRTLIEERYRDGKLLGYRRILVAEVVNRQRIIQAVYYAPEGSDDAYYHPDGRSLRRMFLRSPLRYTRISSRFSHHRFHPLLKRYRPHLGIDYAAPIGTPVRSVADGVVVRAGRKGASGKMLAIRHNRIYSTYYLHLSRFARGVRAGKRVTQGQVIGYVGSTGLSTGPHLDFRLKKHGKYLNPLRYKSLEAPPLSPQALPAFQAYAKRLLAKLQRPEVTPQQAAVHAPAPDGWDTGANGK